MSCGGKLEYLAPQQTQTAQASEEAVKIEFDDDLERGKSVSGSSARTESKNESFVEIDFGIESPSQEEDSGEKTLKVEVEPERKPRHTIEIKLEDDSKSQQSEPKLDLDFEKSVLEKQKKQKERQHKVTLESIESEKSSGDFITKWESPKEVLKDSAKKAKTSSRELDFDELFSELTSITGGVGHETAEKTPQKKEIPDEPFQKSEKPEPQPASEDFSLEIESAVELEHPTAEIQILTETDGDSGSQFEETAESSSEAIAATAAAAAATDEAAAENISREQEEPAVKLRPHFVNETYDVSFDRLISETVTAEFEDPCVSMLRKIEQNMRICKGGIFFLRGESGIGKSRWFVKMREYAEKHGNSDSETFNLVVSDANIFDFDFMIFINLIKRLMKITSNDPAEIAEKFNSVFGDALPDNKKECLNALICLNFVPLKTKLPKHDIEYLISYVIYSLSRNKPVLWFINNANSLNMRTVKFLANLKSLFDCAPMAVICTVDANATVLADADPENIYDFKGFDEERLANAIFATLGTNRIPAEMEKLLREKAGGNMLFAMQLTEYLKDLGLIFEMKGSWRFAKLPDDFSCPAGIDELIAKRVSMLSDDLFLTLKEFTLLNLYSVPLNFFSLVSTTGAECIDDLIKKGYLAPDGDSVRFAARAIMTAMKKMIKIGKHERAFYRNTVDKLISTDSEIPAINKHWLLLSYINSGGIVDKKMNSFLFSSAVYMEKLGFFEISQRCYQTITSSFEADDTEDDFRILPEIKNARLWKIVEPQWAKIFWDKLLTYAKQHFDYHLEMLAKSEILLLDEKNIKLPAIADIIKKFHTAGCYEDEFRLIDKTTDILIGNSEHLEANTFAVRGYKLLRDVIVKSDGKGVRPAEFIYILYIRSACKLAEICMTLKNYPQATEILEESLNYAEKFGISYFKSKILFLLGKIRMINGEQWEDLIKDGFSNALISMDFSILKAFLHFFEENGLEDREWVEPFLEYKNCMNF